MFPKAFALSFALISSAAAASTQVQVGKDGFTFTPPTLTGINPGDTITYNFNPKVLYLSTPEFSIMANFPEPFRCTIIICRSMSPSSWRLLLWLCADLRQPLTNHIHHQGNGHETNLGILCPGKSLPAGNGAFHKRVCHLSFKGALNLLFTRATSGANTFDAFALAANKSSPSTSPPDGLPVGGLRKRTVDVGVNGTFMFSSNNITEPPGTVIEFGFNPNVSFYILVRLQQFHPLPSSNIIYLIRYFSF
jgi:hypothetical protein